MLALEPTPLRDRISSARNPHPSQLASAYHKIVPVCEEADPLYGRLAPDNMSCITRPIIAEPDGKIAFDLIPMDPSRGYCYGEFCAPAARAIDKFRAFLDTFSHFRTSVIHSMLSGQCPFADAGHFLSQLLQLKGAFPELLASLRGALPGLQAVCVVPSRTSPRAAADNWEIAGKELMQKTLRKNKK